MDYTTLNEITVTSETIASLAVTAALLFILPILYAALWKKKNGKAVSWKPLFIGAAGFIVSARVLELGVHMVCIVTDNPISRFINGNTPAFVIYGIVMAGVFEECGRYVIIKFLMKKNKMAENMVMYGIGHGGIEVWSITLMTVIGYLAIAVLIHTMGMDAALESLGVTEELADGVLPTIQAAGSFASVTAFLYVAERIFCMFIHIGLTIAVAYGIFTKRKIYLPLAIVVHAVVDFLPCLYQRGIGSMWAVELWLLVSAVLLTLWGRKLYSKMR